MGPIEPPNVTIREEGRSGSILYRDATGEIRFRWEFGGGDVVSIISVHDLEAFVRTRVTAAERSHVLRFVADEVIRQRSPTSVAEIDGQRGVILIRSRSHGSSTPPHTPRERSAGDPRVDRADQATEFVRSYTKIKAMVGLAVLAIAITAGAIIWSGKQVLATRGAPLGDCVRTDTHIASLIQTTDPHLPEITGRGVDETTSISILLIPLDGTSPVLVPVLSGGSPTALSLARIMGSDGHTIWFDAAGLYGVRLADHTVITAQDLRKANPSLDPNWWEDPRGMDVQGGRLHVMRIDRSAAVEVEPSDLVAVSAPPRPSNERFYKVALTEMLAAGYCAAPGVWIGLHTREERMARFGPDKWIRPVEEAERNGQARQLCKGDLVTSTDGEHFRISNLAALRDTGYMNAGFLRLDASSVPVRTDRNGAIMMYTSASGQGHTVRLACIDPQGALVWTVDTGIDSAFLQRILPGKSSTALVGTRAPVPGKVSEPLVVLVDHGIGAVVTHSLWR